jgi:hypothetical protein
VTAKPFSSGAGVPAGGLGRPQIIPKRKSIASRVCHQRKKTAPTTPARKLFSATWCTRVLAFDRDPRIIAREKLSASVSPTITTTHLNSHVNGADQNPRRN